MAWTTGSPSQWCRSTQAGGDVATLVSLRAVLSPLSISRPVSSRRWRTWCRPHVRQQPRSSGALVRPAPSLGRDGRLSPDAPAGARDHPADAAQRPGPRRRGSVVHSPVDQRLHRVRSGAPVEGGVAFIADIGGLIAGAMLVRSLRSARTAGVALKPHGNKSLHRSRLTHTNSDRSRSSCPRLKSLQRR